MITTVTSKERVIEVQGKYNLVKANSEITVDISAQLTPGKSTNPKAKALSKASCTALSVTVCGVVFITTLSVWSTHKGGECVMVVTWQTIVTIGAVIGALGIIFKQYNKGYDFVRRQEEQDELISEIQEEQAILTYGILACLKGLHEQGVNDAVTEAIAKIEKHLNEKAHKPQK